MNRTTRLALGAGVLIILVAGTALASQLPRDNSPRSPLAASPGAEAPDDPPTAEELAHAAERLAAHGISASTDQLAALAQDYGLGGAVRLLAWSKSTGMSIDELRAMRDSGRGWGGIARELGVHPGIGSIMGGGKGGADDEATSPAN